MRKIIFTACRIGCRPTYRQLDVTCRSEGARPAHTIPDSRRRARSTIAPTRRAQTPLDTPLLPWPIPRTGVNRTATGKARVFWGLQIEMHRQSSKPHVRPLAPRLAGVLLLQHLRTSPMVEETRRREGGCDEQTRSNDDAALLRSRRQAAPPRRPVEFILGDQLAGIFALCRNALRAGTLAAYARLARDTNGSMNSCRGDGVAAGSLRNRPGLENRERNVRRNSDGAELP